MPQQLRHRDMMLWALLQDWRQVQAFETLDAIELLDCHEVSLPTNDGH